jgi:hypothetical protein
MWDPATGRRAAGMTDTADFSGEAMICSVTVGGRSLLVTSSYYGGTVRLWDLATGQQALALHGHTHTINAVCPVTVSSPA